MIYFVLCTQTAENRETINTDFSLFVINYCLMKICTYKYFGSTIKNKYTIYMLNTLRSSWIRNDSQHKSKIVAEHTFLLFRIIFRVGFAQIKNPFSHSLPTLKKLLVLKNIYYIGQDIGAWEPLKASNFWFLTKWRKLISPIRAPWSLWDHFQLISWFQTWKMDIGVFTRVAEVLFLRRTTQTEW